MDIFANFYRWIGEFGVLGVGIALLMCLVLVLSYFMSKAFHVETDKTHKKEGHDSTSNTKE